MQAAIIPIDVKQEVQDVFGRSFKTLRVSLTNVCNLGCVYCVDGNIKPKGSTPDSSKNLIKAIQVLHSLLDLKVIRLTGGEPTVYPGLVPLIKEISKLGVPIKLTTNGLLLPAFAKSLQEAGLREINVSLDAVEQSVFEKVTRSKGLEKVKQGIYAALQAGLGVKLNSVIMRGWNECQILPLLEYAIENKVSLRYLELMQMGHLFSSQFKDLLFPQEEILSVIGGRYGFSPLKREESATANYWKLENGYRFGIIANESTPFCHDCDRLRLDSNGNIYGCLSEDKPIPILEAIHDQEMMWDKLHKAILHKQPAKFTGSKLTMIGIGG